MRVRSAFLALLLVLGSRHLTAATNEFQAIHMALMAQQAAWDRGDVAGFMGGYWNSPELRFVTPDTIITGWKQTLAHFQSEYGSGSEQMGVLTLTDLSVTKLAPGVAFAVGGWQVRRTGASEQHGVFTLIYRNIAGRWVIVLDHST